MPVQSADLFGVDPEQVRQNLNLLLRNLLLRGYFHGEPPIPPPRVTALSVGPLGRSGRLRGEPSGLPEPSIQQRFGLNPLLLPAQGACKQVEDRCFRVALR